MDTVPHERPIEVAIIGGGCASIAAAFELTRAQHAGKYRVTVYQQGWRLGGKAASGRGPAGRIEEHGLHVWLGFYENAFRLMRECYAELGRDPAACPIASWNDAFFPDPHLGMSATNDAGGWVHWTALFPPAPGLPGDDLAEDNPFTMLGYMTRTAMLLQTLLLRVETIQRGEAERAPAAQAIDSVGPGGALGLAQRLLKYGVLSTTAGLVQAIAVLQVLFATFPQYSEGTVVRLLQSVAANVRARLEHVIERDDEVRYIWEIIDLVIAILLGIIRFKLVTDPRGFDAIDDYDCREWLKLNGASERSLSSAFVRGLFDLAMAYRGGDEQRPALAAGQAIRGSLRMFFTYRGAFLWKMTAGMGDVVFAPFYEVLKRRGVRFKFFHRLRNVRLAAVSSLDAGERPYVEALELDVQALTRSGGEYAPLIDVRGLPCWPSRPDYAQLVDGERLEREGADFESFWNTTRVATRTLEVTRDFDFVVLGIGVGAIPHVGSELVERDPRWRAMIEHVQTVPTQAFQIWLREDMAQLGWEGPPVTLSAFAKPFDTWADMSHLIAAESWTDPPKSIAYFCSVLPDSDRPEDRVDEHYVRRRRAEARANAVQFLNHHVTHLWPRAGSGTGEFRWNLLADPAGSPPAYADERRLDSQYWTANVNPSDRYTLALPGTLKYRISPLDNAFDNLTIAGDWTDCGFNEGCVEAAVISGRLAAHALSSQPPLDEIIGYDHP
jgi:uncharacterized protein with NAD-binding domain and iron-sulfur cluster